MVLQLILFGLHSMRMAWVVFEWLHCVVPAGVGRRRSVCPHFFLYSCLLELGRSLLRWFWPGQQRTDARALRAGISCSLVSPAKGCQNPCRACSHASMLCIMHAPAQAQLPPPVHASVVGGSEVPCWAVQRTTMHHSSSASG